jgi:hypothetical protein
LKQNYNDIKELLKVNHIICQININSLPQNIEISKQEILDLLSSPELSSNTGLQSLYLGEEEIKHRLLERNCKMTLKGSCLYFFSNPVNRAKIMTDEKIKQHLPEELSKAIFGKDKNEANKEESVSSFEI